MNRLSSCCIAFWTRTTGRKPGERGASLVEYGLLLALIVIVCVLAVSYIGNSTSTKLSSTASMLN